MLFVVSMLVVFTLVVSMFVVWMVWMVSRRGHFLDQPNLVISVRVSSKNDLKRQVFFFNLNVDVNYNRPKLTEEALSSGLRRLQKRASGLSGSTVEILKVCFKQIR
jgi:hypothetical protein